MPMFSPIYVYNCVHVLRFPKKVDDFGLRAFRGAFCFMESGLLHAQRPEVQKIERRPPLSGQLPVRLLRFGLLPWLCTGSNTALLSMPQPDLHYSLFASLLPPALGQTLLA